MTTSTATLASKSGTGVVGAPARQGTLGSVELRKMDAYWRAANYLSVGQIYLYDNPLLREPLKLSHVKPLVVGHWGTVPGQNFIYVHLNRVIKKYDLDMFYVAGPGHGGPAIVGNVYLEGTWSEIYPNVPQNETGLKRLFKQFSFPGGISSHVAPTTPGSIHEGGELGYSLSHAFGAAFDNPDLIVACVVGDGEAETGPLATAWQSNKFLNPITDGAVLPILHLNGYKISNPTVLARIEHEELTIRQQKKDGTPFLKVITDAGMIPGIKVDVGAKQLAGFPGEKVTEGLDGLAARVEDHHLPKAPSVRQWKNRRIINDESRRRPAQEAWIEAQCEGRFEIPANAGSGKEIGLVAGRPQ